jgi:hypothetical protein
MKKTTPRKEHLSLPRKEAQNNVVSITVVRWPLSNMKDTVVLIVQRTVLPSVGTGCVDMKSLDLI